MSDRLDKFSRVVECGSFTKAAKELHISQPALSMAIDKLEKELQATLITRSDGGLVLTKAGELAYRTATAKQQLQRELVDGLSRLSDRKPLLSFGMIDSVAEDICARKEFADIETTTQLNIVINNSRFLKEAVKSRTIDCAIVVDDNLSDPMLIRTQLQPETLTLVCLRANLDTLQDDIDRGFIKNFIAYDTPSNTYRYTIKTLKERTLKARTHINSTSPAVILDMIKRGKGAGFIPTDTLQHEPTLAVLTSQRQPIICSRPLTLIHLKGTKLTPALQVLIETLKKTHQ